MGPCSLRRCGVVPALVLAALCWPCRPARGQQPPPLQPNPQAPTLAMPAPTGMQRGTTLELTLTGTNLAEPTGLWTSFPAKVTIPEDNNNGKDAAKLRVRLDVPADAPIGFHAIRLATKRGLSNLRLFCIDDLPQVLEAEGKRDKASPQALPVPCVVAGRVDAEASDWYKIAAKGGQRLSFEVLGRRLGSPFDPQLTLYDARTGRELPAGHSNDAPGLQTDARLTYTFKDDGEYLVEVRDVTYRGGADYPYRLRIGDFPCATTPVPMAGKRGTKARVQFAGPAVEGVAPVEVRLPKGPEVSTVWVAPQGAGGLHGWPVALAVSDLDEGVEQEPNDEPAKANRLTVPCGVTGRLQEKGDKDHFVFAAQKGQRLVVEAHTLELHSPTLMYLVLRDAKGAEVAKTNPQAAPPLDQRLDFTAAADGDYVLEAQHLNYLGGPSETYRITVRPYQPGFGLTLGLDRFDVPQGAAAALPILAARRDYTGPIELSVVADHPGITGRATINAGQPAQPNQPAALLFLTAQPDVPPGPYTFWVQGKAVINGKEVVEYVSVRQAVSQGLANLPFPPRQLHTQVGVAVTEKPPFTLAAKLDVPEALRGGPVGLTVTATRAGGFDEEIALSATGLPANVTAALKNIPKGQGEVKAQLNPAANAALGQFFVSVVGKAKVQGKDVSVTSLPVVLVLVPPFEVKAEPAVLKLAPGQKAKIKVMVMRKGGYQGPVAVELRNLPANVTAAKATVEKDKDEVEIEVTAADNAALGDKADVNVLGTATAAGNQQGASPNFTVSVAKP